MKNKIYIIIFVMSMVFIVVFGVYFQMLEDTREKLITAKYEQDAKLLQDGLMTLIGAKQKATFALAVTLSEHDSTLASYIARKKIPDSYYEKLIQSYKNKTVYKNIWIQVFDKDGNSLYRSWTDHGRQGVGLKKADLQKLVQPDSKGIFSLGIDKYDLSIKALTPIYCKGKFVGVVEIVSHFNSIAKSLDKAGIASVVMADKSYFSKLEHPFSKKFIDQYYVANVDVKEPFIEHIKRYGAKSYFQEGYFLQDDYFVVTKLLRDGEDVLGVYVMFEKLKKVSLSTIDELFFKWFLFGVGVVIVLLVLTNVAIVYAVRKQQRYHKNIVDNASNVIIVSTKKEIVEVNKAFFRYFSRFKSFEEFRREHDCICDYFVVEDGYLPRTTSTMWWAESVLQDPEALHKVKFDIDGEIYYFSVTVSQLEDDKSLYSTIFSDITEAERYKKSLEHLTVTDPLTNIGNRRYYNLKIEQSIAEAKRHQVSLSIIMIDIDHFKKVNDEHGHGVGDEVLVEYTKLIGSIIRTEDVFCRIGGEEFVIIVSHADANQATQLAQKIRKRVQEHKKVLPITVSLGVAQYIVGEESSRLLVRADKALYEAKEGGRNRVVTL